MKTRSIEAKFLIFDFQCLKQDNADEIPGQNFDIGDGSKIGISAMAGGRGSTVRTDQDTGSILKRIETKPSLPTYFFNFVRDFPDF